MGSGQNWLRIVASGGFRSNVKAMNPWIYYHTHACTCIVV